MIDSQRAADTCTNCGAALAGEFCHACGQKRFVESDRRLGHLLHQFVASVTDLDGRVWRTIRALLFAPGLLSREYFAGRRARWLSPVSLFLTISVVYFLAPIRGGDLTLQFNQQVSPEVRSLALGPDETLTDSQLAASGQAHTAFTSPWVERRVRKRDAAVLAASNGAAGYSFRDYRLAYDAKADDVSKPLVVLHVPAAALALMLLFAGQRRYFAEHFVFALHYFTFWIVALEVVSQFGNLAHWLPAAWQPPSVAYDWLMRTLLPVYAALALRRAYDVGWPRAIASAVVLIASIILFNLYVYRAIQFAVTFALT
jgi:hypothetical protein